MKKIKSVGLFCRRCKPLYFLCLFFYFGAPVPILTHLGASFDSPEAFFLVICNIFINMVKCHWNLNYRYPHNYVSL